MDSGADRHDKPTPTDGVSACATGAAPDFSAQKRAELK